MNYLTQDHDRLAFHALQEQVSLCNTKNGWLYKLKQFVHNKLNISDVFNTRYDDLKLSLDNYFNTCFSDALKDHNQSNNKMRTFRLFKSDIKYEPYLSLCKNAGFRKYFSKLRLSDHRLGIETGRHKRPPIPVNERLCCVCQTVEDEIHFVMRCTHFSISRNNLFKHVQTIHPEFSNMTFIEQFIFIMSCNVPNLTATICSTLSKWYASIYCTTVK